MEAQIVGYINAFKKVLELIDIIDKEQKNEQMQILKVHVMQFLESYEAIRKYSARSPSNIPKTFFTSIYGTKIDDKTKKAISEAVLATFGEYLDFDTIALFTMNKQDIDDNSISKELN